MSNDDIIELTQHILDTLNEFNIWISTLESIIIYDIVIIDGITFILPDEW